jgi:3-hydroxyacyl-CoA dehydrogenase
VLQRIQHYHAGIKSDYWRPAALIERLARDDKSFAQWDSERVGA